MFMVLRCVVIQANRRTTINCDINEVPRRSLALTSHDIARLLVPSSKPKKSQSVKKGSKPSTKRLTSDIDDHYNDKDEPIDDRTGGRRVLQLLLDVSKLCTPIEDPDNLKVRCIASTGCGKTWARRDRTRILKHAAQCGFIAQIGQGRLMTAALEELARDSDLTDEAKAKLGIPTQPTASGGKRRAGEGDETEQAPPLKRSKSEPGQEIGSVFAQAGRKELQKIANAALIDLIIGCGIPPHIIAKKEFKAFTTSLNVYYQPPSRDQFNDRLVPSRAAAIRLSVLKYLKNCRNLMITFDGGKLLKKKFYSVHITTTNRQSFCLELDDSTGLSMTADYIFELLDKVCIFVLSIHIFL